MPSTLLGEIEKRLLDLEVEELMDLEEKIAKVMRDKVKDRKQGENRDWRKDFLEISTWEHLDNESEVIVDKWKIETF